MGSAEKRPDPYLTGFADGEAGGPSNAAAWSLVAAEWNAYIDGWHVGRASKWGPVPWRYEARVYCPHCGHVALDSVAAQKLDEGYQDIVCAICNKTFRVDVQIRQEYSSETSSD